MILLRKTPVEIGEAWEPKTWVMAHYHQAGDGSCWYSIGERGDQSEIPPADVPTHEVWRERWIAYARHVVKTDSDPLGAFPTPEFEVHSRTWFVRLKEICGSLYMISARRTRGPSILPADLPDYVKLYFGIKPDSHQRYLDGGQKRRIVRIDARPDDIALSAAGVARLLIPEVKVLTFQQRMRRTTEAASAFLNGVKA